MKWLKKLIVVVIVLVGSFFVWVYLQVRALPMVEDPAAFVRTFDPVGKQSVYLQTGGWEGRTIRSPLFPHAVLILTQVVGETCHFVYESGQEKNLSTEGRYTNRDPFWNVFWVEVGRCLEGPKFFGPYQAARNWP